MSARLFNRGVAVTLAKPITGVYRESLRNAIRITDLRVQFEVEKNLHKDPNSASITITNLAERTRSEFQAKGTYVRLDAGYDGQLERLFTGDLYHAHSVHVDTEWETTFELKDGLRAYKFARVNRSYPVDVDGYTALLEAAHALGFTTSEIRVSAAARAELRGQYAGGLAMFGNAADELQRVVSRFGMSWSVQDGRLQVLLTDEHRTDAALVIDETNGLIGSPEFGSPESPKKKPILRFETLLRPDLVPGGLVKLASAAVSGIFRIERLVHKGDTHGNDWTTLVDATAAKATAL